MGTTSDDVFAVTGAPGFIGANLCRRLAALGKEVHALCFPESDMWRIHDIGEIVHVHHVDLRDRLKVAEVVRSVRPSVVYHLAAHGAYPFQADKERILESNLLGTWNLLSACNAVGYKIFVNTGTSSEYGKKTFARREDDLPEPDSFYAATKSCQTTLCQFLARHENAPVVTLRPFSVYGPYEEPSRLIPRLMMAMIEETPIDMVSPHVSRDFVFMDDMLDLYLRVDALKAAIGEVLNVGTGTQTTLEELVRIASDLRGRPIMARWGAMEPRIWDTDTWVADISKLRRTVEWAPKVGVREGLSRCLNWFSAHRNLYDAKIRRA